MKAFVQKILKIRIIRYGMVGGLGIPINDLALFVFLHLMGNALYPLASALAFEISTTINFVLNQIFTYNDQKLHGWEWPKRAAKAQLTSLSALLISYIVGLILVYALHVNYYLANPAGIIVAFIYNYFISKRLVFRPTDKAQSARSLELESQQSEPEPDPALSPERAETTLSENSLKVESTPQA